MSKVNFVVPRVTWSPGREPRAVDEPVVDLDPVGRAPVNDLPVPGRATAKLRMLARDVRVCEHAVASVRATEHGHRPVEHVAAVVQGDDRLGLGQVTARPAPLPARLLGWSAVDHRVALLTLRWLLALARGRLHQPGLNPELAEPQALVGLELDLGARQQRVVVAAGVLEEVARQLLLQRPLISLEPPPVFGGEPRPCTGWGRRRGTPTRFGGRPSPWPACERAQPVEPATRRHD